MYPISRTVRIAFASLLATLALTILWPSIGLADILLGQVDTFENNTTENWRSGFAGNPVVIPGGGPGGETDHYLQLTLTGFRPEGRLTMFNNVQWAGNYLAAGVNAIEVDLKNFGETALSMRVALKISGSINSPGFSTTTAFDLPADGQWHHAVFLLDESHLTRLGLATLTLDELLSGVGELRILNSQAPSLKGDFICAQVGVDKLGVGHHVPGHSQIPHTGRLTSAGATVEWGLQRWVTQGARLAKGRPCRRDSEERMKRLIRVGSPPYSGSEAAVLPEFVIGR